MKTRVDPWQAFDRLCNARYELQCALSALSEWPADRQTLEAVLDDIGVAIRVVGAVAEEIERR